MNAKKTAAMDLATESQELTLHSIAAKMYRLGGETDSAIR